MNTSRRNIASSHALTLSLQTITGMEKIDVEETFGQQDKVAGSLS